MKISYNWLCDFLDFKPEINDLLNKLTFSGLEVEGTTEISSVKGGLKDLVIGKVLTKDKHPNADKLSLTTVDVGASEPLSIVCGAPNVDKDQTVVVAPVNATIFPTKGEPFKIKKAKIRGEVSMGMICAEDEIGLGADHDGILVLSKAVKPGTPAKEYFNIEIDVEIEIGLTPNRGDAASHLGVARDVKALYQKELKSVDLANLQPGECPVSVVVDDANDCPRYAGLFIEKVKVQPSPAFIQNRLKTIGVEPKNIVVDVTNYVNFELGQPLHAFDADKLIGAITVRRAKSGEKITTLDSKERELSTVELLIADDSGPLAIAGVMGGVHSGIDEQNTKSLFLESACFNPSTIRKSAKRQALNTDASFRYERGVDPELSITALQRALFLLEKYADASGEIAFLDKYPKKIKRQEVKLSFAYLNKLCGVNVAKEKVISILYDLDISLVSDNNNEAIFSIPTYRADIVQDVDLIEEVLRIYGFDNINEASDEATQSPVQNKAYNVYSKAAHYLTDLGFFEVMTNSLSNPDYFGNDKGIALNNPLSAELAVLQPNPVPAMLESVSYNIKRKQSDFRVFQLSNTYEKVEEGFNQNQYLVLISTGNTEDAHWSNNQISADYHYLQTIIANLELKLGIPEGKIAKKTEVKPVSAKWKKQLDLTQDVYYALVPFQLLVNKYKSKKFKLEPITKFPVVKRELSLVLDKAMKFEEIARLAEKNGSGILQSVGLLDVYEGKPLEKNQKSYAVSYQLGHQDKTLSEKEIEKVMNRLMEVYEKELNAVIRR